MIRWFARNDIAANFLLVAILCGGVWATFFKIPLEVRPSFTFDHIRVNMTYRGATPEDVETTIAIPIERALEGTAGLKKMTASINSGSARFEIEAENHVDLKEMLEEVQRRIDGITTFPPETERPSINIPSTDQWWEVASVIVSGDLAESDLIKATHQVRDELLALPEVSQILIRGNRTREISVEANPSILQSYRLSLQDISDAIRQSSIDLPAGSINSASGRILLRTKSQAYDAEAFGNIILTSADGAEIRLNEIATVTDGFEQNKQLLRFNGFPCLRIEILRAENESAIAISNAVTEYIKEANQRLPSGISVAMWDDESISLRGRLKTLGWSLAQGGFLVLLLLGLFLRPMLAFWVVIGIPVSFAGGLLLMPAFGMTLNIMSLFAFIIVLGIVVDDAIVTGENIYSKLREGMTPLDGAVIGTKQVATPVTFGIITTVVAFLPLYFFDGFWGTYTKQIPPVVGAVLLFSLIESKLILPSHLKHLKTGRKKLKGFARFQKRIADSLERFVDRIYRPSLAFSTRHRYTFLAGFFALGLLFYGICKGGHLGFEAIPSIDRYQISASVQMIDDTPYERTDEVVLHITEAARKLSEEFVDSGTDESLVTKILTSTGVNWGRRGGNDDERASISLEILPPSMRSSRKARGIRNDALEKRWRELIGEIKDARHVSIRSQRGRNFDELEAIEVELRGLDSPEKTAIADEIEDIFEGYDGKIDNAWNDIGRQRNEFEITLKPRAHELGLTESQLARQIRSSFFGSEAQRIQRDREEIRVMVRLPELKRDNIHTLESLKIDVGTGPPVPFSHVAELTLVKAPSKIERIDGARVSTIFAQPVDKKVDIIGIANDNIPRINALVSAEPGLSWRYQGFIAEHEATNRQTTFSFVILLATLYALLAIPFRSLSQPIFVLLAIPFGIIGALLGHMLLDQTPSYLSIFGILALAGIVVNDSLVMVDFTNQRVRAGDRIKDAVLEAGAARFRPIFLTSLTTFFGLLPLILDDSIQAQFLIPMAISLAFGILFATTITLYLIPCAYLANEDIKRHLSRAWQWYSNPFKNEDPAPVPEESP